MTSREERADEIQEQIKEVLLRDWDPIGVAEEPRAHDEYDAYVGGVYRLLASGAQPRVVAEHLARIEAERMGFTTVAAKLLRVAQKLCALDVRLKISDGAA
ncbi:MAG: hypothetical protein ACREKB_03950 [Candidatus Rokuibacteriota bacterium]